MASIPERGFLVIADLTGYTAYLSGSELEHAPAIAGDLLETIVGRLDSPFRLAKFEGDAAFLWVEDGRADGPLLLDAVEASYLSFRRRLRSAGAQPRSRIWTRQSPHRFSWSQTPHPEHEGSRAVNDVCGDYRGPQGTLITPPPRILLGRRPGPPRTG